jgi:type IX secretion system PorP/SprF family membrane protein
MRKDYLLILMVVFGVKWSTAQQRPHYTQYILNNYIINPALAGIENYTDVKLSHRHQWVGIQDAPVTTYLTVSAPINKKDDRETATSFHMDGENPRGRQYWQDYEAAQPHSGVGLQIINDRTGPLNRFSMYGTYAYHIGISQQTSLAAGFSVGFTNNSLNTNKLDFGAANPIDPAVAGSGYLNKLRPDLSAGLWLYSADYFAGLAIQQILPQGLSFGNDTLKVDRKAYPHFFIQAGYRMMLSDDISFLPSAVVRLVDPLPVGVDLNAKFQYRDLVWIGAAYRVNDGIGAMLGVNISNTLNLGYAYDYTTSKLNSYTKGTHEIVLGFLLGNKFGDWCPRNIW